MDNQVELLLKQFEKKCLFEGIFFEDIQKEMVQEACLSVFHKSHGFFDETELCEKARKRNLSFGFYGDCGLNSGKIVKIQLLIYQAHKLSENAACIAEKKSVAFENRI